MVLFRLRSLCPEKKHNSTGRIPVVFLWAEIPGQITCACWAVPISAKFPRWYFFPSSSSHYLHSKNHSHVFSALLCQKTSRFGQLGAKLLVATGFPSRKHWSMCCSWWGLTESCLKINESWSHMSHGGGVPMGKSPIAGWFIMENPIRRNDNWR